MKPILVDPSAVYDLIAYDDVPEDSTIALIQGEIVYLDQAAHYIDAQPVPLREGQLYPIRGTKYYERIFTMTKERKWVAGPRAEHEQRVVHHIAEETIFPRISNVVICQSLGIPCMPALVTRTYPGGKKMTGYLPVQLKQSASGDGTHIQA